jgi:transcriptional regulator with PAS, ATPase and Fis domain
MVGRSTQMLELRARVGRVAQTNFTILVEGESGAGKELVAREIHAVSPRRRGPFVAVNCAALVETLLEAELFGIEERTATGVRGRRGKFELADRGTLFLDEVADLSPASQAKLLRVLQDLAVERVGGQLLRQVDTRVVAATNRSLHALVQAGRFRADLYYRLSGVEIYVPPLRARRDDIPMLVDHFLARHRGSRALELAASAIEALIVYEWPGNVRQLARVVERAVALAPGPTIRVEDLPGEVSKQYDDLLRDVPAPDDSLRAWSSRYVRLVLERCDGNKRRACDVLAISYHTLQSLLDYTTGASSIAASLPHATGQVDAPVAHPAAV